MRLDTRDSPANPYRGGVLGLSVEATPWRMDRAAAAKVEADGRYVLRVPPVFHRGGDPDEENPPTDVIALSSWFQWALGDLPFYQLPSLGGRDTLRGYIGNRWTGEAAWHTAAEYRFWFLPRGIAFTDAVRIERLGGALFFEMGSVAGTPGGLLRAAVRNSWGVSLRLGFERSTLFRLDVGFSDEGHAITLAHGLSF
ncbi:MAG: hypothetical protein Kow0092_06700 [Deferrisomatales bacterium]